MRERAQSVCQTTQHHELDPLEEVMAGGGGVLVKPGSSWWLLSRSHCLNLGNYLPPPPLPLLPTSLNISCKMRIATFEKPAASLTDGVGGPKQAMNLWLMSRLISERATSALTINLPPPSLPTPPRRHLAHASANTLLEVNGTSAQAKTHTHTRTHYTFRRKCCTFWGLETRHLASSQLPLMYYSRTLRGFLLE